MLLNCGAGEDSWQFFEQQGDPNSQSKRKSTLNIHWKDWCWSWCSNIWPPDVKSQFIQKDPDAGKDWRQKKRREWQRMRCLDSIADSTDKSLNKLQETVEYSRAWEAADHGVTKNQTQLSNSTTITYFRNIIEIDTNLN